MNRTITKLAICASLAALTLSGCNQAAGDTPAASGTGNSAVRDPAAVKQEVLDRVHTSIDAFVKGDAEGAAAMDAPDVVVMFHGQPNVVGKDADMNVTKMEVADPANSLKVDNESVEAAKSGDLAVYTASYTFGFTNPATEKPAIENGNWVLIFKRQPDGTMKLWRNIISDTPADKGGHGS